MSSRFRKNKEGIGYRRLKQTNCFSEGRASHVAGPSGTRLDGPLDPRNLLVLGCSLVSFREKDRPELASTTLI